MLLFALSVAAAAETADLSRAVNLSESDLSTFSEAVFQKESSFLVLFTAPRCESCLKLEGIWSELATEYASSSTLTIAFLNSTTKWRKTYEGGSVLRQHGVSKYPAIKYFNPPETRPHRANDGTSVGGRKMQTYEGKKTAKSLRAFAATLKPECKLEAHVDSFDDHCTAKQQAEILKPYMSKQLGALKMEQAELQRKQAELAQKVEQLEQMRLQSLGNYKLDTKQIVNQKTEAENEKAATAAEERKATLALQKREGRAPDGWKAEKDEF